MKKCIVFLLVLAMTFGLPACKIPAVKNEAEPTVNTAARGTTAATLASVAPTTVPTEIATAAPELATTAPTDTTDVIASEVTVAPTEVSVATATETDAEGPTEEPTEAPTEVSTEEPTEVPHSELYVPGVSQDKIVAYFNEVVLDMEYTTGDGDASVVQKWERPISYRIEGVPSHRDAQSISTISKQLNAVEGFPGIRAATGLEQNVTIYFLHDEEFKTQFSHVIEGETADGAVQFWYYNDTNAIYSGRIGYRKDAAEEIRDSVIPEELVNLLGINDTTLREDSITYQNGSEVTELSAVDWVIIKLLYNPKIHCGMTATECETIIRELYY